MEMVLNNGLCGAAAIGSFNAGRQFIRDCSNKWGIVLGSSRCGGYSGGRRMCNLFCGGMCL